MSKDPKDISRGRFRCGECGGAQAFDADSGRLRCGHCGVEVPVVVGDEAASQHLHRRRPLAEGARVAAAEAHAVVCGECGAEVVFAEVDLARRCTFCGSPEIAVRGSARATIPTSVLPFRVDRKHAERAFSRWLGRLWFRPNDLSSRAAVHQLAGVYVPYWCFDAEVDSTWTAESGHYHYTDEKPDVGLPVERLKRAKRTRHTKWERAWGRRHDRYVDMLVCASHGLPRELADSLRTYNMHNLRAYSAGYLAGFHAEEHGVTLDASFTVARTRMETLARQLCAAAVPGDTHRALSTTHVFSEQMFQALLLPVWVSSYRYRGRAYRILVNGESGEVSGKAPFSVVKIALFVFALVVLVCLVYVVWRR